MNLQERPTEIYPGFFLSDKITPMQKIVVERFGQLVGVWVGKINEMNNYKQRITAEESMEQLKEASEMLFPVHVFRATIERKEDYLGYFMCIDANNDTYKVSLRADKTESGFSTKRRIKGKKIEHIENKYTLYGSVFVQKDELHYEKEKGKVFIYTAMYDDTRTRVIFDNTHVLEFSNDGLTVEEKIEFIKQSIKLPFTSIDEIYAIMQAYFDRSFENCTIKRFEIVNGKECERGAYIKKQNRFYAYGDTLSNGATLMVSRNNYGAIEWTCNIDGIVDIKQDMEGAHKKQISIVMSEYFMNTDMNQFFSLLQQKTRDFISVIEG